MRFKKIAYFCIGLPIFFGAQPIWAANLNEVDLVNSTSVPTIDEEIKTLKFLVKKEIASQALIQSEVRADVIQLKSGNEALVASLKQNALTQDSQFSQLRDYFHLNNLILSIFTFVLLIVLWMLRGVNKKLAKGIEIRLGGLSDRENEKKPLDSPGGGNQLFVKEGDDASSEGFGAVNRGVSAEDLHRMLGRQLGLEEGESVRTPPAKQDEALANEIHSVIKKRMMGFMRPTQPPKL
ncbi:hypothetical protein FD961_03890 [Polynucleobacter sp. TSB-Sco08W16]|uniref:hypothetical protein n=1 Tax=Polynucleobacter sp. TSB-Sco08W16 TaxID=1758374 RepID=UPI001BFD6DA9|nr:hypothetical protein [Polynucleobacter sp. TSB-Sco08W16]QWD74961.1 hypothetical protein FD961_03890 [Polynucleobacter sp. TSB-Sco08W16]